MLLTSVISTNAFQLGASNIVEIEDSSLLLGLSIILLNFDLNQNFSLGTAKPVVAINSVPGT